MSHPYHEHREHPKGHSRVKHIMKSGGIASHSDEAADKKLFSKLINEHEKKEMKVEGKVKHSRFARGGKVKHKKDGHHTNIAIVVPQKGGANPPSDAMGPQAGAPPLPPSPMGAPALPPGLPPGGPPGMPMRARGGKVIGGDASAENLKKWSQRASHNSYARGGRLPTAGAMTGVGRLQKARGK
jgi:hypothetical protein